MLFARNVRDPEQLQRPDGVDPRLARDRLSRSTRRAATSPASRRRAEARFPGALALGAVDDVELTARVARRRRRSHCVRRGSRTTSRRSPTSTRIRSTRSSACARSGAIPRSSPATSPRSCVGLQEGGVAACAKHFPGHGATEVDSHLGLPVVPAGAEDLRAAELAPFRAAIAAGTQAVMTAHLVVPALDDAARHAQPCLADRRCCGTSSASPAW